MSYPHLDVWQYRLAKDLPHGTALPGGWRLEVGPDLAQTTVRDAAGVSVGYLLGFAIDLDASRLIGSDWQTTATLGENVDAFAEQVLLTLGGRFLWVFATDTVQRLYTDCSAQVPCVYDATRQVAGASAHALFDTPEYEDRFDKPLFDALGVDGEGWYPGGLTAHRDLWRLFANHYLDLQTWSVHRHWHLSEAPTQANPDDLVDEIIDLVRRQINAFSYGEKRVGMALTAGLDTRTLLACARASLDNIDCITVVGSDRHATDTIVAGKIAKTMDIKHLKISRQTATDAQRDHFIRRGGHCNGDTNSRYHTSVWSLKDTHVFVGGLGAELARGFFWKPSDTPVMNLTPQRILSRMGLPSLDPCVAAVTDRLNAMPTQNALQILELFYSEDRHCSWYASQFCADPTLERQAPLLTYRGTRAMMQLPVEWKQTDKLGHEIIRKCWPELAEFPYNSLGPLRDRWIKLQRLMANPSLIVKKLRKMRA